MILKCFYFSLGHSDNECLPISWHCDGQNDCNDGSDEISCTPANTTIAACSGSEFQCTQGLHSLLFSYLLPILMFLLTVPFIRMKKIIF